MGWTKSNWSQRFGGEQWREDADQDNCKPKTESLLWEKLSKEEKCAAKNLGFNKETW